MNVIRNIWNKIPTKLQKWLRGLEVAVLSGLISSVVTIPVSDFTTRAGWTKFVAEQVAVMAGCVRLYLAQSPLQNILTASQTKSELTDGNLKLKTTETNVVTGPNQT